MWQEICVFFSSFLCLCPGCVAEAFRRPSQLTSDEWRCSLWMKSSVRTNQLESLKQFHGQASIYVVFRNVNVVQTCEIGGDGQVRSLWTSGGIRSSKKESNNESLLWIRWHLFMFVCYIGSDGLNGFAVWTCESVFNKFEIGQFFYAFMAYGYFFLDCIAILHTIH